MPAKTPGSCRGAIHGGLDAALAVQLGGRSMDSILPVLDTLGSADPHRPGLHHKVESSRLVYYTPPPSESPVPAAGLSPLDAPAPRQAGPRWSDIAYLSRPIQRRTPPRAPRKRAGMRNKNGRANMRPPGGHVKRTRDAFNARAAPAVRCCTVIPASAPSFPLHDPAGAAPSDRGARCHRSVT
jgi:hypothetical protein